MCLQWGQCPSGVVQGAANQPPQRAEIDSQDNEAGEEESGEDAEGDAWDKAGAGGDWSTRLM